MSSFTSFAFIPKYSAIISLAVSAVKPPEPAFSISTVTDISGSSNGANPTNHPFTLSGSPVSAEPVFPATSISNPANVEYAVPPSSVTLSFLLILHLCFLLLYSSLLPLSEYIQVFH